MNNWSFELIPEAEVDFRKLDGSQKKIALKMLRKLTENPLPQTRGGYGRFLGNDNETGNLTGFLKLKDRNSGLRIVYELIETQHKSSVKIIGLRTDKEVYREVASRLGL